MEPLDPPSRRWAFAVAVVCAVAVGVLAIKVRQIPGPLRIDSRGRRLVLAQPFGIPLVSPRIAHDVQTLGNTPIFAGLVVGLVAAALALRDWLGAAIAAVAPAGALLLTEFVGKPLVGRREGRVDGFPSGHTTAMAGLAAVVVLLAYRRWGWRGAVVSTPIALALPTGMVGAVVRLHSHLFTDAIAGVLVGIGVVFGVASLVSQSLALLSHRGVGERDANLRPG